MHLINEGITRARSVNTSAVVTVEWGLSAPSDADRSGIGFQCSLDEGTLFSCK